MGEERNGPTGGIVKAAVLTALAMMAFAANSLLARAALMDGAIDPWRYTVVRLVSGALMLLALLAWRDRRAAAARAGGWLSGLALFVYAVAFSVAYIRIGAALGAVVLFAVVQISMVTWGMVQRQGPTLREAAGLAVAFAAFVYLVSPGLAAPDPVGTALMAASGIAWAAYSLRARGVADPLGATAGNFWRAALLGLPLLAASGASAMTATGFALAVVSGAITSGVGYAVWYAALPHLTPTKAAVVQLTVPVIAAFGAVTLLDEPLTVRLVLATTAILAGVALTISAPARPTPVKDRPSTRS